jgi:hypothetical protein
VGGRNWKQNGFNTPHAAIKHRNLIFAPTLRQYVTCMFGHCTQLIAINFTAGSFPLKGHFLSQHVYPMICISGIKNYCDINHPIVVDLALLYSVYFNLSSQTIEQSPWAANILSASPYILCILLNPKFNCYCHKSLTIISDPVHKTVAHTLAPWLRKTSFNYIFTIYTYIFLSLLWFSWRYQHFLTVSLHPYARCMILSSF